MFFFYLTMVSDWYSWIGASLFALAAEGLLVLQPRLLEFDAFLCTFLAWGLLRQIDTTLDYCWCR